VPPINLRLRLVASVLSIAAVAALAVGSSAPASAATLAAWGENESGILGTGSFSGPEKCEAVPCSRMPIPVAAGLSNVVQVSAAENHALALLSDGTVRAWGYNEYGELGNDSTNDSASPVIVSGLSNAVQVAAGTYSSMALLSNGTVMAWGDGEYGELGDGATTGPLACENFYFCSRVPVPVPGISGAVAIAAGDRFNLALLADGSVLMWGRNYYGLNGDGRGEQGLGCNCVDSPRPVPGVAHAMAISAGSQTAMALISDGTAMGWGQNSEAQLGDGTSKPFLVGCECEGPVRVSGLTGASAVAAGEYESATILGDGTLRSWGYNGDGELGIGTSTGPETCVSDPCGKVPVTVGGISGAAAIDIGDYQTVVLLSDGTARSWGFNPYGQIGDGTTENSSVPVAVHLTGASGISAGINSSFAILGPSQTLSLSLAGAGSGVVGGPAGVLCPSSCSNRFPQGAFETLRPEASPGSGFAGFSGACTGTGLCRLAMGRDQDVTATFGPPMGTRITQAKVNRRKRSATFRYTAPGAITGFQCELVSPRRHRKHHRRAARSRAKARKHRKPRFASCGPESKAYRHLRPGHYEFRVRALDMLGADANPAKRRFVIKHPKPRRTAKR
jgi:alpha-tubulin suppressor-like RCC1 family protein